VHMDRERQCSGFAGAFDHARNAHAAGWFAALIDEDVGRLDALLLP
jgi:hypothetical protein